MPDEERAVGGLWHGAPAPKRTDAEEHLRTPPANVEAEQALLGAILVNNAAYERVAEIVKVDDFFEPVHRRIFGAMVALIERGQQANPVSLKPIFDQDGALAEIGGGVYLVRLAAAVVTIVDVADYAETVHEMALLRQIISVAEDTFNDAHALDLDRPASAQIEIAEQKLFGIADAGMHDGGFRPLKYFAKEAMAEAESAYKRDGRSGGVPTGFIDLDRIIGGLHATDLVIIAGRPSMGKTALATNIGFDIARRARGPVGMFSLEMGGAQLATRILAERSHVSASDIRKGAASSADLHRFIESASSMDVPFFIDPTAALSSGAARTRARRLRRQAGASVIIIDYLQLMHTSARQENRAQAIGEITRGLKTLAMELGVAVVALSQLSRAVEAREDKRPMLSDLRESGSIEQDADLVIFVYRAERYLDRAEPQRRPDETDGHFNTRHDQWARQLEEARGVAELIVAKQRNGPIGSVRLRFDAERARFEDFAREDHLPERFL